MLYFCFATFQILSTSTGCTARSITGKRDDTAVLPCNKNEKKKQGKKMEMKNKVQFAAGRRRRRRQLSGSFGLCNRLLSVCEWVCLPGQQQQQQQHNNRPSSNNSFAIVNNVTVIGKTNKRTNESKARKQTTRVRAEPSRAECNNEWSLRAAWALPFTFNHTHAGS